MNQSQLVDAISSSATNQGVSKTAIKFVLDELTKKVQSELKKGGDVTLPGLVKFSAVNKPARTGRNPSTGASLQIPAKTVPKVAVLKQLKDALL